MTTTLDNVIAGIADGNYDDQLDTLQEAIRVRRENQRRITMIGIRPGTRVRFNNRTRPKYLQGKVGTITKKNQKTVVLDLDLPVQSPQSNRRWHKNIKTDISIVEVLYED